MPEPIAAVAEHLLPGVSQGVIWTGPAGDRLSVQHILATVSAVPGSPTADSLHPHAGRPTWAPRWTCSALSARSVRLLNALSAPTLPLANHPLTCCHSRVHHQQLDALPARLPPQVPPPRPHARHARRNLLVRVRRRVLPPGGRGPGLARGTEGDLYDWAGVVGDGVEGGWADVDGRDGEWGVALAE